MTKHGLLSALILWTLSAGAVLSAEDKLLLALPDINQLDGGPNGRMDCGPAAAANYILWLSDHGYRALAPADAGAAGTIQPLLVELEGHMATDGTGTGVRGMAKGLKSFFEAKGYSLARLDSYGWRPGANGTKPDLQTVKETLKQGGGVFLNFGWYKCPQAGVYDRTGGHWVCLAGYGVGANGAADGSTLVIHDPSPRCGTAPRNEYIRLSQITDGTLTGAKLKADVDAKGYYTVDQGWKLPKSADTTVLDAVVCIIPAKATAKK